VKLLTYLRVRHLANNRSRVSSVGIATVPRSGRFGFRGPVGTNFFFLFSRSPPVVAPPGPLGTGVSSRGLSGCDVKLTTHLRLVPRLRMSGAIPLHTVYVFRGVDTESVYLYLANEFVNSEEPE
jgi:hypothetical protein